MITLYSTGCPKCDILTKKLQDKGVEYTTVSEVADILLEGIREVPVLDVDGERMAFGEAVKWVNGR